MIRTFLFALTLAIAPVTLSAAPATYESPEKAVGALIASLDAQDREAALKVFGPESEDILLSGEQARDRELWLGFLETYKEANRIAIDSSGDLATLYVGNGQWPFPIRMEKQADGFMGLRYSGCKG